MKGKCYSKANDESSIVCKHCGLTQNADLDDKSKSRKWRFLIPMILLFIGAGLLEVSCTKGEDSTSIINLSEKESLKVIKTLAETLKKYDNSYTLERFKDGLTKVTLGDTENGKYGFINIKGKEATPCIYDEIKPFCDGMARAKKDSKYGFINTKGEEAIPCKYDIAYDFHDGFARVISGYKYNFINTKGEEVIPCLYDRVERFYDGLAIVSRGDKTGYIDKYGHCTLDY